MSTKTLPTLIELGVAALMLSTMPAFAQHSGQEDHAAHDTGETGTQQASPAASDIVNGEIRKIAKDTGRLTIRHDDMPNLGMPAMTMVFRVQDPAMLDQVKQGDRVTFVVEKSGSQLVVTRIDVKS